MKGTPDITAASPLRPRTERYLSMDIAKAIAIILVVLGHYCPPEAPEGFHILQEVIYSFHMPLFFFASGFIYQYTWRPSPYVRFEAKKFRRLMIPYFTTSLIVISLKLVSAQILPVENPVTWHAYAAMLYSPSAGEFLWFIWSLWSMMLIIPLFRTLKSRLWLAAVSLAASVIVFPPTDILALSSTLHFLIWFVAGTLASDCRNIASRISRRTLAPALLLIFAGANAARICYMDGDPDADSIVYLLLLVTASSGIALTLILSSAIARSPRSASFRSLMRISDASYIIYLFHTLFEGLGKGLLSRAGIPDAGSSVMIWTISVLVVTSAGIAGPYLLYKLVQRRKFTRLMFGLPTPRKSNL